jgi:hypothetical protein
MEFLGQFNLFTSHFIMGCSLGKNNNLDVKSDLNSWLKFKDTDFAMDGMRSRNTQYVAFLHEFDVTTFKNYLHDLINIYKEDFPYSEKEDFMSYTFGYSLYFLEEFITREYRFVAPPIGVNKFDFYTYYHEIDRAYLDYAITKGKSIIHFKQLYKQIIKTIRAIDFNNDFSSSNKNNQTINKEDESLVNFITHSKGEEIDNEINLSIKKEDESFANFITHSIGKEIVNENNLTIKKEDKSLASFITHSKGEEIVNLIKIKYKGIRGKQLKLLFKALQQTELIPNGRVGAEFHRLCKKEFCWDIASYNAMSDYKFNDQQDDKELEQMKNYLNNILV